MDETFFERLSKQLASAYITINAFQGDYSTLSGNELARLINAVDLCEAIANLVKDDMEPD